MGGRAERWVGRRWTGGLETDRAGDRSGRLPAVSRVPWSMVERRDGRTKSLTNASVLTGRRAQLPTLIQLLKEHTCSEKISARYAVGQLYIDWSVDR